MLLWVDKLLLPGIEISMSDVPTYLMEGPANMSNDVSDNQREIDSTLKYTVHAG